VIEGFRLEKRRIVLIFLGALGVITFLDRLCIAVAGARMQEELRIDPDRWGWILGAFILAYGLFEIPTGALGDRIGPRRVLTRIVLWWSVFTALTGAAWSFSALLATSFLFGAGEAGAYPNASGVIARWFPARERARTQGFVWGASRFGGALSPLLVVPLQAALGWRASFWIFGALGVLWAAAWWTWFHDDCRQQPGITGRELGEIAGTEPRASHRSVPWRALLRSRQLWLIVAMYWCYAWGSWFYFSWFPTYLVRGAKLSERQMGLFAALPFLLGVAGNLTGGFLSDRLVRRWGLRTGRRAVGVTSLAVSSVLVLGMAMTRDRAATVAFSALCFGIMDLMLPVAWAVCLDVGAGRAGVVTGMMNTAGQFGGFVCTVLFGYMVRATGSYHAPLFAIAGMLAASAALFSRIDPTRPLVDEGAQIQRQAREQ